MNTHADKTKENKSQSVANEISRNRSGSEFGVQFIDNRPEATAQRMLQEMSNNSAQVEQLCAFQEIVDKSPTCKKTAPLQTISHDHPVSQPVQFRLWDNNVGIFSTLNDDPVWGFLGNSVYDVSAQEMRRYAPVNWYRAPDEVSHDYDDRHMSFMDEENANNFMDEIDENSTFTAEVQGNTATIKPHREDEEQDNITARLDSDSGEGVMDFHYDEDTQSIDHYHWGHDAIPAEEGASADAPDERPPLPEIVEGEEDPYADWRD